MALHIKNRIPHLLVVLAAIGLVRIAASPAHGFEREPGVRELPGTYLLVTERDGPRIPHLSELKVVRIGDRDFLTGITADSEEVGPSLTGKRVYVAIDSVVVIQEIDSAG